LSQLRLSDVLYSPNVGYTLVSIGQLDDAGFTAQFGRGKCLLTGPDGEKIGEITQTPQRVYRVEHDVPLANSAVETLTLCQLHRRMGHPHVGAIRELLKGKMVDGIRLEYTPTADYDQFFCESCVYAKATRKSVPKVREGTRAASFGEEVHTDLWEAPLVSRGGKKFWDIYIDDNSCLTNIYFLATKDETFTCYKAYDMWVEVHMKKRIKFLNSDRGGEFLGAAFVAYLKSRGTLQKLSVHDTHQQSGIAERRNRTIAERMRALLHASGLPKYLWTEAARHAVWLLNRTTTKAVDGMTPFEAAFGKKPNLKGLREFGEKVWVRVEKGNKLGGRVREGRWLGVDEQSKGVRVWWPDTKTVTVERNCYYDNSRPTSRGGGRNQRRNESRPS
jgi:hypothetical protein